MTKQIIIIIIIVIIIWHIWEFFPSSLLKSAELFSAFWPILIMLWFEWLLLVFLFPNPPVLVPILESSAPTTISITIIFMFHSLFSVLLQGLRTYLFLLSFSFSQWSAETAKSTIRHLLFFVCLLTIPEFGSLTLIRWCYEYFSRALADSILLESEWYVPSGIIAKFQFLA